MQREALQAVGDCARLTDGKLWCGHARREHGRRDVCIVSLNTRGHELGSQHQRRQAPQCPTRGLQSAANCLLFSRIQHGNNLLSQ